MSESTRFFAKNPELNTQKLSKSSEDFSLMKFDYHTKYIQVNDIVISTIRMIENCKY